MTTKHGLKKICVIGKGPPLEGGTATHTLNACIELAKSGCIVHLITNSNEAEDCYKYVMLEEDLDFPNRSSQSNFIIHYTSPVANGSYIPFSKPFLTQLIGKVISLNNDIKFDCVIGWYLEPYGMAAAIIGKFLNIPVFIRHAGSDIGRLLFEKDLEDSYKLCLNACKIITSIKHKVLFESLGVKKNDIIFMSTARLPEYHFLNTSFDFENYRNEFQRWLNKFIDISKLSINVGQKNSFENDKLKLGVYGKVGITKGSFALVEALSSERVLKNSFYFMPIVLGHKNNLLHYFRMLSKNTGLFNRTMFLPPIPPWKIPAYLQFLDVVFLLENKFQIVFHTPILMREILASGTCLVCSRELVEKSSLRVNLVNFKNVIIVEDPNNTEELIDIIDKLIKDKNLVKSIGSHGKFLSNFYEESLSEKHPIIETLEEFSG